VGTVNTGHTIASSNQKYADIKHITKDKVDLFKLSDAVILSCLHQHLILVRPDAHTSTKSYFDLFFAKGGVVESAPLVAHGEKPLNPMEQDASIILGLPERCPSAHFMIEPDGDLTLLGTSDSVRSIIIRVR
jgi:hypothetical protein